MMKEFILKILYGFEILLGIGIIAVILIALFMMGVTIFKLPAIEFNNFHITFETILGNFLLLVVGLEMAIMMIRRDIELLPEILAFVIARKLLLVSAAYYEILIGVVSIAGIFAIRKYLLKCKECRKYGRLISTKIPAEDKEI